MIFRLPGTFSQHRVNLNRRLIPSREETRDPQSGAKQDQPPLDQVASVEGPFKSIFCDDATVEAGATVNFRKTICANLAGARPTRAF